MDYDILNIIGDYVKNDIFFRMEEEKKQNERMEIFKFVDDKIKQLTKDGKKEKIKVGKDDMYFAVC